MDATPITFESVAISQRMTFLRDLSNLAQASQQKIQSAATDRWTDAAQNFLSINTAAGWDSTASSSPLDQRGQFVDITV